jgi:hypothetical protein
MLGNKCSVVRTVIKRGVSRSGEKAGCAWEQTIEKKTWPQKKERKWPEAEQTEK